MGGWRLLSITKVVFLPCPKMLRNSILVPFGLSKSGWKMVHLTINEIQSIMKKKILITLIIIAALGASYVYYQFNKPHKDIAAATPVSALNAAELFAEFEINENEANQLYLGKIVQVTGVVYSVELGTNGDLNVLLMGDDDMFGVAGNFNKGELNESEIVEGEQVTIKGECAGMLSDVVLIRCVIVK
ncbi:MAG TPA: hypothetical protein ENL09_01680 [Bacteroidetes bacterium]|nr:hypothetical protein [Bacteroidota bacterium]